MALDRSYKETRIQRLGIVIGCIAAVWWFADVGVKELLVEDLGPAYWLAAAVAAAAVGVFVYIALKLVWWIAKYVWKGRD